jgi:hypothetical protein
MYSPLLRAAIGTQAACGVIFCAMLAERMLTTGPEEDSEQTTRLRMLQVAAAGGMMWPFAWAAALANVVAVPLTFGLLWPLLMIAFDMHNLTANQVTTVNNNVVAELQSDSNSLIGIAFAFGTLSLSGQLGRHKRLTFGLVLLSLIICIAFIIPAPVDKQKPGHAGMITAMSQRVLFQYASGFIISAMALSAVAMQ